MEPLPPGAPTATKTPFSGDHDTLYQLEKGSISINEGEAAVQFGADGKPGIQAAAGQVAPPVPPTATNMFNTGEYAIEFHTYPMLFNVVPAPDPGQAVHDGPD